MAADSTNTPSAREAYTDIVLAIHGGAGVINRKNMTPEMEQESTEGLQAALNAGFAVYRAGGSSLDIVEAAVRSLEDCPVFNSGHGSVFTSEGKIEMDAAIMDGKTRKAGAIANVTNIRNPISAARAVMEKTAHVLLVGEGAEQFAAEAGLEIVDPSYFWTEQKWVTFERILQEEDAKRTGIVKEKDAEAAGHTQSMADLKKFGTVGAVALDVNGSVAAATSTGGTMNKKKGRVGDSPLIGAGTYADNETCAISCTGHGEYFIRFASAYDVCALMKYKQLPLSEAASYVVHDVLMTAGGRGGLISLDAKGNCALPFNSEGMFRGCITSKGVVQVGIYGP